MVAEPPAEEEIPPLVIDLAGEACPEREGPAAKDPRYLDVTRLAKSLRNRIGLLRKGESPAKLALGEAHRDLGHGRGHEAEFLGAPDEKGEEPEDDDGDDEGERGGER